MNLTASATLRFTKDELAEIDDLARGMSTTRAEIVRRALALSMPFLKNGIEPNPHRSALLREYNQVALDLIVEKLMPDMSKEVAKEAKKRIEYYHEVQPLNRSGQKRPTNEGAQ